MGAATCFSQGYRQVHPKFHLGRLRPPKRMFQRSIMTNIQYSEQLKFIVEKLPELQEMITAKYMYVEESLDKKLQV